MESSGPFSNVTVTIPSFMLVTIFLLDHRGHLWVGSQRPSRRMLFLVEWTIPADTHSQPWRWTLSWRLSPLLSHTHCTRWILTYTPDWQRQSPAPWRSPGHQRHSREWKYPPLTHLALVLPPSTHAQICHLEMSLTWQCSAWMHWLVCFQQSLAKELSSWFVKCGHHRIHNEACAEFSWKRFVHISSQIIHIDWLCFWWHVWGHCH